MTAVKVAIGVSLVGLGLIYAVAFVVFDSDYSAFLPAGTSSIQRSFMTELREGVGSRVLLIELRGDSAPALARTSERLAAALGSSPLFRYVNNGSSGMGERELAVLERNRYALSDRLDQPEPFARPALAAALAERLEALSSSASILDKRYLTSDPTAELRRVLSRLTPRRTPQRIEGVWFDEPGTSALLLAETRAFGSDLDGQQKAVAALESAFAGAAESPAVSMNFSSPGTMAVRSRALIAADARTLSIISMSGVVIILAWAYRSPAVVLLCLAPAVLGLLAGIVVVNAVFGSIHGITLAFGATLLGEAVDYPTYLLTQVKATATAVVVNARIARMLRLAVLTTCCGAFALLFSGFPGLAQLGLLTITGVLTAGAATWWILPHVVPAAWVPRPVPRWTWLRRDWATRQRPNVWGRRFAALLVVICALVAAWSKPLWDDDLASMSPLPASMKATDARLRAAMGAPDVRYALVIGSGSRESALRETEALRPALEGAVQRGEIAAFDLVTDYMPSEATQARRRAAIPEADRLRADLAAAAAGLPFRPDAFEPFVDAAQRARNAPSLTPVAYADSALSLKVEGLLRRDGDGWQVIVPVSEVRDAVALARALPADAQLLDMRAEATGMMAAYRERGLAFSGAGFVLILAVLAFGLRSIRSAAVILLPVALAVVTAAALLIALGEPLTVFHYVALLLTTGIGVNYALLLASDQARDDRAGMWRTLAVVSGTAVTTFGILAFAHAPVLHAIGVTVCIGVVLSLAFATLLVEPRRWPGAST